MRKKLFTLLFAFVASVGTMVAEKVQIGDLYYDLDVTNQTAIVTCERLDESNYSGLITATIPSTIEYETITYNITSIGEAAFLDCTGLTSVTIPNSVTSIGEWSFSRCTGLTSITIPNSVTSIGGYAFRSCTSLNSIGIPDSNVSIGYDAFGECSSLTRIELPNNGTINIEDYAFSNCVSLANVTIGNGVVSIGNGVFEGCSNLKSVIWNAKNYSNTSYSSPFYSIRGQIESFVFGENVESIPDYCCEDMNKLGAISIPNSVTSIGYKAFYNCTGVTNVEVPNSVISIGGSAFYGVLNIAYNGTTSGAPWGARSVNGYVDSLFVYSDDTKTKLVACSLAATGEITIPSSVARIGTNAFNGCNSLTNVIIPNSVIAIEDEAFYGCTSMVSVNIPNTVANIGQDAFYNVPNICYNGEASGSPWGAKSLNGYVDGLFVYTDNTKTTLLACSSAATGEVVIPNNITTIAENAFSGCKGIRGVKWDAKNCTVVSSYEKSPFYNIKSYIKSFIFSDEIETIPQNICYGMTYLKYVYIGKNVRYIGIEGDSAFINCTSIDTVVWNAVRCNDMEYSPFYYSRNHIKSFTIADDIERIPANLCWGIKAIEKLTIPSSVNYIGKDAFYGSNLTEVHIPNSVEEVGIRAFANCPLQKVHWGVANQADYEEEEFHSTGITVGLDASNLNWSNVYVYAWSSTGSTITSAWPGTKVSKNANGIYTFTFPSSYSKVNIIWNNGTDQTVDITNITSSAIYSLTSSSGKNITYTTRQFTGTPLSPFINSTANLTEFTFGENVKRVPALLCEDMNALTEVIIPQNVEYLGKNAFKGCSNLATLSLGENITTYGENVFSGCPALTSIYNYRERPAKLGTDAFKDVDYFNCTLYVLAGSVNMYKAAGSDWKDFYYIKPIGTTETTVTEDKVTVSPADNSALFTWRTSDDASTYTLQITQDGVVFCTLVFDADGLLKGIAFALGKDGHAHTPAATLTANGMQFTVTGLSSASKYAYRLAVADSQNNEIIAYSGEFATNGYEGEVNPGGNPEGIDEIPSDQVQSTKILREGQIFILRGDKTYTTDGRLVR